MMIVWGRLTTLCLMVCLAIWGTAAVAKSPQFENGTPKERIEPVPKDLENVGIDEKLGSQVPLNMGFEESDGARVGLSEIVSAKRPAILTFNYSDCPMLCSLQLDGFVDSLKRLNMTAGKEFDILTVSIDPEETQERSALFKQKYLDQYQRPEAREGWHFLRGKTVDVERLAHSVGFKYAYVKERKEYAHTAGLMVLSPEGTVTRYLYGIMFDPRDLKLALVEAAEGKVGSTVDRILLYCFHYDSSAGKYAPVAANIMRVAGFITMIVLGAALSIFWIRDQRKQQIPLG